MSWRHSHSVGFIKSKGFVDIGQCVQRLRTLEYPEFVRRYCCRYDSCHLHLHFTSTVDGSKVCSADCDVQGPVTVVLRVRLGWGNINQGLVNY